VHGVNNFAKFSPTDNTMSESAQIGYAKFCWSLQRFCYSRVRWSAWYSVSLAYRSPVIIASLSTRNVPYVSWLARLPSYGDGGRDDSRLLHHRTRRPSACNLHITAVACCWCWHWWWWRWWWLGKMRKITDCSTERRGMLGLCSRTRWRWCVQ